MLIDTHAHLYWESFKEDFGQVIDRSIEAGVTTIINVGVDVELSKKALHLVQGKLSTIPGLTAYSTIGIHPHEAVKYSAVSSTSEEPPSASLGTRKLFSEVFHLEQIYQSNTGKVIAVGECGLDYFFDHPALLETSQGKSISIKQAKDLQKQLFQAQIDLAKKLNLPLIVHCRDDRSKNSENTEAWDEILKMIGDHPAILHCYSGLPNTTNYILRTPNLLVSFAATITYPKNEYLREAAKLLPLEKMVLETDCPFLPPQGKRGQRNEPANTREIAQLVADLKGISLEEVADETTNNVKRLFYGSRIKYGMTR